MENFSTGSDHPLKPEEQKNFKKISDEKEKVYKRVGEVEREEINKYQKLRIGDIDDMVEQYRNKTFTLEIVLNNLVDMATHDSVDPNVQVYALEQVLRLTPDAVKDTVNANQNSDNIFFDTIDIASSETNTTAQRVYFESILHYYTSANCLEKVQQDLQNGLVSYEEVKDYMDTIKSLRNSAQRYQEREDFKEEPYNYLHPLHKRILNSFSTEGLDPNSVEVHELKVIELLSKLYGNDKEQLSKSLPTGQEEKVVNESGSEHRTSSGEPWMLVALPEGYIPSVEKIQESKDENFPLGFVLSRETVLNGKERYYVTYRIDERTSYLYYERMRYYKDKEPRDTVRLEKLKRALKQRIWQKLENDDPEAVHDIGGIGNLTVRMQTVKDYPIDYLDEDFEEVLDDDKMVA